ncbi:MAG: phage replisome organizer N-terminal domain-containing protein, partial [Candidatus Bathyarchaeota archaeon]|nr:phage replisome organizer N-terminal domain-containing protein [Candidatus Bathyarchaeum sp.]
MAEVKWIKIYTDMLSNKKIKRIRRMPEGNNVILIWVFLIAEAGKCNRGGGLYLTDLMPFNADDLAIEFDFEVDIIKMALAILQKFEMLEIFDDVIYIKNWEKYQNIDGMNKIREQNRLRNIRYREKQKLLNDVTVTSRDATDIDKELDIDKEKNKDISSGKAELPTRHKYGEYKNVLLSDEQMEKLKTEYSDWETR